ncbi:hypothetical protein BURPS668_A1825 [Burkholderia pseudomallei 668]|nr:hypothetical protein BURPS668_A1825 [Burkholderia pseudomallei 668]
MPVLRRRAAEIEKGRYLRRFGARCASGGEGKFSERSVHSNE